MNKKPKMVRSFDFFGKDNIERRMDREEKMKIIEALEVLGFDYEIQSKTDSYLRIKSWEIKIY